MRTSDLGLFCSFFDLGESLSLAPLPLKDFSSTLFAVLASPRVRNLLGIGTWAVDFCNCRLTVVVCRCLLSRVANPMAMVNAREIDMLANNVWGKSHLPYADNCYWRC